MTSAMGLLVSRSAVVSCRIYYLCSCIAIAIARVIIFCPRHIDHDVLCKETRTLRYEGLSLLLFSIVRMALSESAEPIMHSLSAITSLNSKPVISRSSLPLAKSFPLRSEDRS